PPESARRFAACMTGPSAVGSENGIPSSISAAPASSMAYTSFSVVSRSGSPQVMKGINAFFPINASCILLIDILPSVSCNGSAVLVAPAGNIDHHDLVSVHLRRQLSRISDRVGALDGGYDPFRPCKVFEGVHSLVVCHRHILCPSSVIEVRVLRSHARIVQPGRDRIHRRDLPVLILTEVRLHPMEDSQFSCGNGRRSLRRIDPSSRA